MLNALSIGIDESERHELAVVLASCNVGISHCANMDEAKSFLEKNPFRTHLVIVDMDCLGEVPIAHFRRGPLDKRLPMIGLSKSPQAFKEACGLEDAGVAMVARPLAEEDIRGFIDQNFRGRSGHKATKLPSLQPLILIIEDDMNIAEVISRQLLRQGYRVMTAVDGLQAAAEVRQFDPDMVICDMHMPVMDGFQFCQEMKETHRTKDIPLLAISSNNYEEKMLEMGVDSFMQKPLNISRLKEVVASLLKSDNQQAIG